ncbi:hypothetical protein [Sporolactobacillus inulinus]|uniref:hypothetical protein n=1 Tax=Sporolactobacillus inulinus TaxID=2078 RepID=UPI001142A21D|nr:hypothetical protein [Sporolactobacillus inulinus]
MGQALLFAAVSTRSAPEQVASLPACPKSAPVYASLFSPIFQRSLVFSFSGKPKSILGKPIQMFRADRVPESIIPHHPSCEAPFFIA